MMQLADLIETLTAKRITAPQNLTHAVMNSREIKEGGLFVALPGETADGHQYLADAFARGAVAAIVDQDISLDFPMIDCRGSDLPEEIKVTPVCLRVEDSLTAIQTAARHWVAELGIRVIGITGSVGKSSTKEVLAEVLGQRFRTAKTPGNYNSEIGLPLSVVSLSRTDERAVLEMGFYVPGEITFLCQIAPPSIGVVTNIGQVHAERAGSQAEIARGKTELVQVLPADGWAVLNADDPLVLAMAQQTNAQVFTVGLSETADLWASEIEGLGLDGLRFNLNFKGERHAIETPLLGRHSVYTAMSAVAVALIEGLTWDEIIVGLRNQAAQLRMKTTRLKNGALLIDDTYNASPQSTVAALQLLADIPGHKIAILGDMLELGPYEVEGHQRVGQVAAEIADRLITVGRRAKTIAQTARHAGMSPECVAEAENTEIVIDLLIGQIQPNDIVLIKGSRGMHMDKLVPALETA